MVRQLHFNETKDIKGEELVTEFDGGEFVTRVGDPIVSFYGYRFEGVFTTCEEAEEANALGANRGQRLRTVRSRHPARTGNAG